MPATGPNPKILIAEDSTILNHMLRDVFEENGFEVFQAFNGSDCKTIFVKEKTDIVLIDVHMPRTDGIEALKFIKERSPRTIAILMSGAGNAEVAVSAMKSGADDFLNKPFSSEEVVKLAQKLLENRRFGEENVKLRKQIRESERYLAHLTTIINEALITTDSSGKIQFANRSASIMWGYSQDELRGKDFHFLIRSQARAPLSRDLVKDTIRDGKVDGEFYLRRKDNSAFPGYLSTSVIKENKRVTGIVIIVADLTRQHEIERRLRQSEKLASLGAVVEGVAHEVRNSLTSLGGFALRLKTITADNPTYSKYTQIILDDVSRLEKMVRDIEDYVKFSKLYSFDFRKVDLISIVERARDKVWNDLPSSSKESVSFSIEAEKRIPQIEADPSALEQVFYNLIINACDAMPGGGWLKVKIKKLRSSVSISFMDSGVGIHKEDLSEIFNPFFTSKTIGAGMGLCKAHFLIEEHRGAIKVSSVPNKGSVFEVFIPSERLITGTYPWEN